MAVSIEHSCSEQLNVGAFARSVAVLVPRAWPSVRSAECLRIRNARLSAQDFTVRFDTAT
jgi:hypothetical protein